MNRQIKPITQALRMACTAGMMGAVLCFAGCAESPSVSGTPAPTETPQATPAATPQSTPAATPQPTPTVTPQPTPTAAPQAAPTAAPVSIAQNPAVYPSSNLEKMLGAEKLSALQTAGVIAREPGKVTAQPTSKDGIQLEKVETLPDNYIIVTLNARLSSVDTSDITIKKYSDNWYSLAPTTSAVDITDVAFTLNDEGKTVLLYQTAASVDGVRVVPDYSAKQFKNLDPEIKLADNYLSWQMDHGGWDKGVDKQATTAWSGKEKKNKFSGWSAKDGTPLGTIDNDATYTQMRQIAAVYRQVPEEKYKESVLKGLDFIFNLQYESGGFAQVYPKRGNYSDYATFNDEAMINVLIMLEDMRDKAYPFDSDIIPEDYQAKIEDSIARGIDFILKSQITSQGKLTAWCAQHDPVTYKPMTGRAYELPSISGSESVAVVKFLIHQPNQTEEIQNAVNCALEWFRESEVKGLRFDKNDPEKVYFIKDENSSLWYRFYEIDTNRGIFCDRDGIAKYDITEIGDERRNGYSWSGSWPRKLLTIYNQLGFYENLIEVSVVKTDSADSAGNTLQKNSTRSADSAVLLR